MKSAEFPEITEYKERFIERVRRNFFSYIEQLSGEADSWSLRRPVVAISGGPDSTALLIALSKFAAASNIKLRPVHVNHKLRSEESETDEEFCKSLCKGSDWDSPLRVWGMNSQPIHLKTSCAKPVMPNCWSMHALLKPG